MSSASTAATAQRSLRPTLVVSSREQAGLPATATTTMMNKVHHPDTHGVAHVEPVPADPLRVNGRSVMNVVMVATDKHKYHLS